MIFKLMSVSISLTERDNGQFPASKSQFFLNSGSEELTHVYL